MHDLTPYLRPLAPTFPSRVSPLRSPPRVLAAIRELVERTSLPCAAIGVRVGVSAATVSRWRRREGWVRPALGEGALPDPGVPSVAPPTNPRFRSGRGRRYVPDVVERVRVLVEGTALSQAAIAAKTGIGVTTVFNWTKRRGWARPAEAERWKPLVAAERAGFGPPLRAGFGRVGAMAERELARLAAERRRIAAEIAATARLAARARRRAELHGRDMAQAPRLPVRRDDGTGPIRLSTRPRGRTGAARPEDLVAHARGLIEGTILPQADIARRLGVSRPTLIRWAQAGGWIRPVGAPAPFGEARHSRERRRERSEARTEARHRMREAERLLDALEREGTAEPARIAEAVRALEGVPAALRRQPLV